MYDILILGGGPAGLTAAIYAGRAGKKTAVVHGPLPGGAIALTEKIENFSGYEDIDGFSLTYKMKEQAERFGAEMLDGTAVETGLRAAVKWVVLDDGRRLEASKVILATGTQNRKLGLENEGLLTGRGLSYCATCDGNFFRGQTVVVNGGGDTAVTDALYLSKIAKTVYLVHRRKEFRAAAVLTERLNDANVIPVTDSVICGLKGVPLQSVKVKNVLTGETRDIEANGLFVAIGTTPNTDFARGQVYLDESGYIITDIHMRTNLAGVYAAGDVRVTPLRQVITACADGAIAAESCVNDM
jgi:thioredoxin reductase (NADPH)